MEVSLLSTLWAIEGLGDLKQSNVIFEISSVDLRDAIRRPMDWPIFRNMLMEIHKGLIRFVKWQIEIVPEESNQCAMTEEHHYQSYVAQRGPQWLQATLEAEAVQTT
ncbi:hypothetical protein V5N11_019577 [Cardamine amara subsp. amara]|uniref:RNase H type-1 domain-containing protein n=1 Tax=Cardamine amara subsp. amara TaxID=228776 RepID=A0ABD1C8W4_CARAN